MVMPKAMKIMGKKNLREFPLDSLETSLDSYRLPRAREPIVTERTTGKGHLRVKKTIKKISKKVQGANRTRVGKVETRGGNDTERLCLDQPDASDKTTL